MKMLLVFLSILICCSSCVLPIPHRRVHVRGMKGQVLDERTKEPVVGAKIGSGPKSPPATRTDREGRYEVKPVYGWHGAYLLGPISYSLLPYFDLPSPASLLWVFADGYQSQKVNQEGAILLKRNQ